MTSKLAIVSEPKTPQQLLSQPNVKERFAQLLGKKAPGFISSIISAINSNKALRAAEPNSIIGAAALAATLDLPINPALGFAYLVPYKNMAQFQIGWKGIVQLALRTGQYETINATEIYDGQITKNDPFTGEMEFKATRASDSVVGYLLFFKLMNGFKKYVYWSREKCELHAKKYSQTYKNGSGPWVDNFDTMAIKTVVKNGLSKWGILSIDMQTAFLADQAVIGEDGERIYAYVDSSAESAYAMPQSTNIAAAPNTFTGAVKTVAKTELGSKKVLLIRIADDATKAERKVYVEASDFLAEGAKDSMGKQAKVTVEAKDGVDWLKGIEDIL